MVSIINSSNIHQFLAMIATNKANSLYAFLDGPPGPLKITVQGGHVKGILQYTNATLSYGAMLACGDSRVGIC